MAATPKKIVVEVEPRTVPPARTAPVQSRIGVRLHPRDEQSLNALGPVGDTRRGPWSVTPRQFAQGQFVTFGQDYFMIMGVVHDLEDPSVITLLVSIAKAGLPS